MLGVLREIAFKFLIEHLVPVIDVVDILLPLNVHAIPPELAPLLYLLLKVLCHPLHSVFVLLGTLKLFDALEVGSVETILIEDVPAKCPGLFALLFLVAFSL